VPEGGGLAGAYVFADFVTATLHTLRVADGEAVDVRERSGQIVGDGPPPNVAAFVVGGDGALYAVSLRGSLFRLDFGAASGAGDDLLRGGGGDDVVRGGAGNDSLFGGAGDDSLRGGLGEDFLRGRAGADDLKGGAGDDDVHGGAGADRVRGGAGDDRVNGGAGADVVTGGGGADVFVFRMNAGSDLVTDYRDGEDRIDLSAYGLDGFASVAAALSDGAEGAGLDLGALGGAGSVVFRDVDASVFDEGDFIF
ncbi:MAG: hypothetical protein AAGF90_04890, partial [Pseudomonadota bacterium]